MCKWPWLFGTDRSTGHSAVANYGQIVAVGMSVHLIPVGIHPWGRWRFVRWWRSGPQIHTRCTPGSSRAWRGFGSELAGTGAQCKWAPLSDTCRIDTSLGGPGKFPRRLRWCLLNDNLSQKKMKKQIKMKECGNDKLTWKTKRQQ